MNDAVALHGFECGDAALGANAGYTIAVVTAVLCEDKVVSRSLDIYHADRGYGVINGYIICNVVVFPREDTRASARQRDTDKR